MSEGFVAIFCLGWLAGVISTILMMCLWGNRDDKGKSDMDSSIRIHRFGDDWMDRSDTVRDSNKKGDKG